MVWTKIFRLAKEDACSLYLSYRDCSYWSDSYEVTNKGNTPATGKFLTLFKRLFEVIPGRVQSEEIILFQAGSRRKGRRVGFGTMAGSIREDVAVSFSRSKCNSHIIYTLYVFRFSLQLSFFKQGVRPKNPFGSSLGGCFWRLATGDEKKRPISFSFGEVSVREYIFSRSLEGILKSINKDSNNQESLPVNTSTGGPFRAAAFVDQAMTWFNGKSAAGKLPDTKLPPTGKQDSQTVAALGVAQSHRCGKVVSLEAYRRNRPLVK